MTGELRGIHCNLFIELLDYGCVIFGSASKTGLRNDISLTLRLGAVFVLLIIYLCFRFNCLLFGVHGHGLR